MMPLGDEFHPDTDTPTFPLTVAALRQQMPLASQRDLETLASSLDAEARANVQRDTLFRFGDKGVDMSDSAYGSNAFLQKNAVIAGVGALLAAGTVVAGTAQYDGHFDGAANSPGFGGSDWHTDMFVHHHGIPSDAPITVRLHYAAKGESPSDDSFVPIVVQPGQTEVLRDVVASVFQQEGVGVIQYEILGDAAKITVNGNTFNRVSAREQYGQQIFGRSWDQATGAGVPLIVPGQVNLTDYRANLGFTASPSTTQVRLVMKNKSGNILHEEIMDVNAGSWNQITKIAQKWGDNDLPGFYFEVVGMNGPVDDAMSIVNEATGDGANIVGRSVNDSAQNMFATGAAFLTGANGTNWRSNLQLINPQYQQVAASLVNFLRGQDNSGEADFQPLNLAGQEGRAYPNVLGDFMAQPNGTASTLWTDTLPGTPLMAFMQTLNQVGTDDQGRTIAYGQNVPFVNHGAGAVGDLEGVLTGVDNNDNFRANLLLQNTLINELTGEYEALTVDVEVHTAAGLLAGVKTYDLRPGEYLQDDKVVEKILGDGANLDGGTLVVRTRDPGQHTYGGVNAAVSVVNGNRIAGVGTGDGRLIGANIVYKANNAPTIDCMENLTSGYEYCDADGDNVIDNIVGVSACGPPPAGPERFEWSPTDAEGDTVTLMAEGVPEIPDYVVFDGNRTIIDPSEEHVGQQFVIRYTPIDHHGKAGLHKEVMFKVSD